MRFPVCALLFTAAGITACGALSGLDSYAVGTDEGGDPPDVGLDEQRPADDAPGADAPITDDAWESDGGAGGDATMGGEQDTGTDAGDLDSNRSDASKDAADAAPPVCSTSNCGGCCSNGQCFGGASTETCGAGGGSCRTCAGSTPACSGGKCTATPPDAGTPMCVVASCRVACIPFYQVQCCKADQTCGCMVSIGGPCN